MMKHLLPYLFSIISGLYFITPAWAQTHELVYVSPKPGSAGNSCATNIILCFKEDMQEASAYSGMFYLRENGKDILFRIENTDQPNKLIIIPLSTLSYEARIDFGSNTTLPAAHPSLPVFHFWFKTQSAADAAFVPPPPFPNGNPFPLQKGTTADSAERNIVKDLATMIPINMNVKSGNEEDLYFMGTLYGSPPQMNIVNGKGQIVLDRKVPNAITDFKMHADSTYSYIQSQLGAIKTRFIILDKNLHITDSFGAGNGYIVDAHDLAKDYKTGHYFVMALRQVTMDLSTVVTGGSSNARLVDLVVQEIHPQTHQVLFEWKCIDHLPVTDAFHVDLTATTPIDWIHCNGLMLDTDTSFILCSRHTNEVTRVNRVNGNIIWRMGNRATSQNLQFLNDSGFYWQHNANRLPNGNILLFDNGNFRSGTRYSRAVEYKIDEVNMTAEKVWEYRHSPNLATDFMGSAQRLPNGNTIIGWGHVVPGFTEIDSNKQVVCEGGYETGMMSYRVWKCAAFPALERNKPRFTVPDGFSFCALRDTALEEKLPDVFSTMADENIGRNFQQYFWEAPHFKLIMEDTLQGIYAYYEHTWEQQFVQAPFSDTLLCRQISSMPVTMQDGCGNTSINWSSGDTGSTVLLKLKPINNLVWVETHYRGLVQRDSMMIRVTPVNEFEIFGPRTYNKPFEVNLYSVPFYAGATYEWKVENGHLINGFENNAATIQWGKAEQANMEVIITDPYGCVHSSGKVAITYSASSGLAQSEKEKQWLVFPNPFIDRLNIAGMEGAMYTITTSDGRTMGEGRIEKGNAGLVNTAHLHPGVYFLSLEQDKHKEVIKLMKME